MMTQEQFKWVERCARLLVPRARSGDDEALQGLIYEARPLLLSAIPAKLQGQVSPEQWAQMMTSSILEAVILWQPERSHPFSFVVDDRMRGRLGDYFLRQRDLMAAAMEGSDDKGAG
jgi:hypothetical protein